MPNADGVVQLDSSCMHGPLKRAGGVASLEGVRTPSRVAREVMNQTDHHLLVGKGAQTFARNMGFTDRGRPQHAALAQALARVEAADRPEALPDAEGARDRVRRRRGGDDGGRGLFPASQMYGTINCDGINAKGEICGVTTTSGLFFKIPGRVGDSPILGAGLYVDGAGRRGGLDGPRRGEPLQPLLVPHRREHAPRHASQGRRHGGVEAHQGRTRSRSVSSTPRGNPNFNINFYALNAKGEFAGVAMYAEDPDEKRLGRRDAGGRRVRYAVCDAKGPRTLQVEGLLPGTPDRQS